MSSFEEQDMGRRVDGALATITSGPAPAAAIVARGRRIRQRRRAARAGVAVVAALAVAVPSLGHFAPSRQPILPPHRGTRRLVGPAGEPAEPTGPLHRS